MGRKVKIDVNSAMSSNEGTIVNYPISFEGSEVKNLIEQEIVGGNRWDVNISKGEEEYTARIEAEVVSGKPFFLALGSVNPGNFDTLSTTIEPYSTVPLCTITGVHDEDTLTLTEARCDRLRLNWSSGEYVTYEAEFIGTGADSFSVDVSPDWSLPSPTCASLRVFLDGSTVTQLQSGNLEINNNLQQRYACGRGHAPVKVRERRLEVNGALTVGDCDIDKFPTASSIDVEILGLDQGAVTISCGSIWFEEYPDEFTGHDIYEVEFSWIAQPISGGNLIEVVDGSSVKQW